MAILKQIPELEELLSLDDSTTVLVHPSGGSKAYRSTVGAIKTGLARTNSPTFTGVVIVPNPPTNDVSQRAASTQFVDNQARSLISQLKQIKQMQSAIFTNAIAITSTSFINTGIQLAFTPTRSDSSLIIELFLNGLALSVPSAGVQNWATIGFGWSGSNRFPIADSVTFISSAEQANGSGGISAKLILPPNHDGFTATAQRTYQIFAKVQTSGANFVINNGGNITVDTGRSGIVITEVVV